MKILSSHRENNTTHLCFYRKCSDRDFFSTLLGGPSGFRDLLLNIVRPEAVELARRKLNEAQNFFKHAHRDHEEVLGFLPEASEFLLLDACERYFALTGERVSTFDVFRAWFMLGGVGKNLTLPSAQDKVRRVMRQSFPNPSRESFFVEVLPLATQLRIGGFSPDD